MLGLVRPPFGHTSVLSSWSMPPPVDRIRDLPSSSDLSFPQPVHESVCGTSLENGESRRGVAVDRMSDEYITVAVDTFVYRCTT
jgi:hypothetical protein